MINNMHQTPPVNNSLSWKKRLLALLFVAILNTFFCALLYSGTILWRSSKSGAQHSRWIGTAYQADSNYGYYPKPNSLAYHSLLFGEQVPVLFNEQGFRVPFEESQRTGNSEITILFLGDSFTHGYGVPAEKTFPELVARQLDAQGLNAGGPGWGIAQMVLRARQDIPRFEPNYCIVQYSPWLISRSQTIYGPTNWGHSPVPYYYQSYGKILIHPPVFASISFSLPISQYAGGNLLSFIWNVGARLYIYDDYQTTLVWIKRRLGFIPSPVNDRQIIVDIGYKEIEELCSVHGGKMLILKLYGNGLTQNSQSLDRFDSTYYIIDTLEPLASRLSERNSQAWKEQYSFIRGDPPRIVDEHPNALAHRIIAGEIVDQIRMIDAELQ